MLLCKIVISINILLLIYEVKSIIPNHLNISNPEEYVNILGGTDSRFDVSHGSTLPLITLPWGFNNYAPQTDNDPTWPGWWFHPSDRRFFGLRVTHQPSPWIRDYGNFLIKAYMPHVVEDSYDFTGTDDFTGWSPKSTTFSPYYFQTNMLSYSTATENTRMEFVPTSHGGIMRIKFPKFDESYVNQVNNNGDNATPNSGFVQTRRVSIVLNGGQDSSQVSKYEVDSTCMITGYTKVNSGGVGDPNVGAFAHYFAAIVYGGMNGDAPLAYDIDSIKADSNSVWIDFDPRKPVHEIITIYFATSFLSVDQAILNLQSEVSPDKHSFESVLSDAKNAWKETLSRVKITSIDSIQSDPDAKHTLAESIDLMVIFYSSLYRASIFPRSISEYDANGEEIHWSPYTTSSSTSRIGTGPMTTDSGFWDAWNTVYPLLSLVNRPVLGYLMQGWVNAYKESGWLPKWASPGNRGCMVGTQGDVSLADAIVKEIPGFDVTTAYEAIRKDAFQIPSIDDVDMGRECMESYLTYGYVPHSSGMNACTEVVSRTQNYWHSDFAISQAAMKLGYTDDANELFRRAQNYSLLFDSETGFFRSKVVHTAKFTTPFDEFAWGGDYTEAGPWQFRFYVPYDPLGLASLYEKAGKDMCDVLESVHTLPISTYHLGGYSSALHEMIELADHCWGQFSHNNQPNHHMLYMNMYKGYGSSCAANGQARIRQALTSLYNPSSAMFAGDEDNGEMGAWYILSALGLYNLSPGSDEFVFGAPLFNRVEIDISDSTSMFYSKNKPSKHQSSELKDNKKILVIEAINNNKANKYVQSISWNNVPISGNTPGIKYSLLKEGGLLTFVMGFEPLYANL